MAGHIKELVEVIVNATPRLAADVFGREWPSHPHHQHTELEDDDHPQYVPRTAGPDRSFTGHPYLESGIRLTGKTELRFDDSYRATHSVSGDWTQPGIDLSAAPGEWQALYDAVGGTASLIAILTTAIESGSDYWARDAGNGILYPINTNDTLKCGDGTQAQPTYAFKSDPKRGMYNYLAGARPGIGFNLNNGGPEIYMVDNEGIPQLTSPSALDVTTTNGALQIVGTTTSQDSYVLIHSLSTNDDAKLRIISDAGTATKKATLTMDVIGWLGAYNAEALKYEMVYDDDTNQQDFRWYSYLASPDRLAEILRLRHDGGSTTYLENIDDGVDFNHYNFIIQHTAGASGPDGVFKLISDGASAHGTQLYLQSLAKQTDYKQGAVYIEADGASANLNLEAHAHQVNSTFNFDVHSDVTTATSTFQTRGAGDASVYHRAISTGGNAVTTIEAKKDADNIAQLDFYMNPGSQTQAILKSVSQLNAYLNIDAWAKGYNQTASMGLQAKTPGGTGYATNYLKALVDNESDNFAVCDLYAGEGGVTTAALQASAAWGATDTKLELLSQSTVGDAEYELTVNGNGAADYLVDVDGGGSVTGWFEFDATSAVSGGLQYRAVNGAASALVRAYSQEAQATTTIESQVLNSATLPAQTVIRSLALGGHNAYLTLASSQAANGTISLTTDGELGFRYHYTDSRATWESQNQAWQIKNLEATAAATGRIYNQSQAGNATLEIQNLAGPSDVAGLIISNVSNNGQVTTALSATNQSTSGGFAHVDLSAVGNAGTSFIKIWDDQLQIVDANHAGASPAWTQGYIVWSDTATGWDNYKSTFGEVGLLEALVAAASGSGVLAHNDTTGKQGGTTGEYYHLTAAQHTGLTGGGSTSLHSHTTLSGLTGERVVLTDASGDIITRPECVWTSSTATFEHYRAEGSSSLLLWSDSDDNDATTYLEAHAGGVAGADPLIQINASGQDGNAAVNIYANSAGGTVGSAAINLVASAYDGGSAIYMTDDLVLQGDGAIYFRPDTTDSWYMTHASDVHTFQVGNGAAAPANTYGWLQWDESDGDTRSFLQLRNYRGVDAAGAGGTLQIINATLDGSYGQLDLRSTHNSTALLDIAAVGSGSGIVLIEATGGSVGEIRFDSSYRSGWTQEYITLSDSSTPWSSWASELGSEMGLMEGVLQARRLAVLAAGSPVGSRPAINFIQGTNVTLTVADDAGNDRVNITIAAAGGGSGDVVGPASATDNAIARYDGTTGKLIQNSALTIDDAGGIYDGVYRLVDYAGGTLYLGQDTGDAVANIDLEFSTSLIMSLAGSNFLTVAAGGMDLLDNDIINAGTIQFESEGQVTAAASAATIDFDNHQQVYLDCNDQSSLTVTINEPTDTSGPARFTLRLEQGSTTPSTITWVTEGTHALNADFTVPATAGITIIIAFYFDGSAWWMTKSGTMTQVLSS